MIPTADTPYFTDDHQHGWLFAGVFIGAWLYYFGEFASTDGGGLLMGDNHRHHVAVHDAHIVVMDTGHALPDLERYITLATLLGVALRASRCRPTASLYQMHVALHLADNQSSSSDFLNSPKVSPTPHDLSHGGNTSICAVISISNGPL